MSNRFLLLLFVFFRNDNDGRENVTVSMSPWIVFSCWQAIKKSHDKISYHIFKSGQKKIPHFAGVLLLTVLFWNKINKENNFWCNFNVKRNYVWKNSKYPIIYVGNVQFPLFRNIHLAEKLTYLCFVANCWKFIAFSSSPPSSSKSWSSNNGKLFPSLQQKYHHG